MECMKVSHRCLENLTWIPLSKRRENARLIHFHKILVMVPHSCLEKAGGHTRKIRSMKFRPIGYNRVPYMDNRFLKTVLERGMAFIKELQRPALWIYLSLN